MPLPEKYKVLFNGDVNFLFQRDYRADPPLDTPYSPDALDGYVDKLAATGIDAYLINVNAQVPWYPSKRLKTAMAGYTRGDAEFVMGTFPELDENFSAEKRTKAARHLTDMLDRYLDIQEQGVDWVQRLMDRAKHHNIAPMISIRMNDAHGANNWDTCFLNSPHQRDEKYWLTGKGVDPDKEGIKFRKLHSFDHAEVRDYYLTMIEEVIEMYDPAGIELDWVRTVHCCEPPVSEASRAAMLNWMRHIRYAAGKRPVILRVPDRVNLVKHVGLDVATWAHEGLIDAVGPTNFFQGTWDTRYDRWREAVGSNVTLLGVVESAPNWMPTNTGEPDAPESYRLSPGAPALIHANAAGKHATGVDAIEVFNFFVSDENRSRPGAVPGNSQYEAINLVGDKEGLRSTTCNYTLAIGDGGWMYPEFENAEQLPVTIGPGLSRSLELAALKPAGDAKCEVHLVLASDAPEPRLGVSINGSWPTFNCDKTDTLPVAVSELSHYSRTLKAFVYQCDANDLHDGFNSIRIYNEAEQAATLKGFELLVTPTAD